MESNFKFVLYIDSFKGQVDFLLYGSRKESAMFVYINSQV